MTEAQSNRAIQRAATRRRLLAAGVRLMEKGNYRPMPQQIVDEIDMHKRSFHEHFGTTEVYMTALLDEFAAEVTHAINKDVRERNVSLARLVLLGKRK